MHRSFLLAFLGSTMSLAGCADVHVRPISASDTTSEGVRFYRPWPYLLVTAEPGDKGITYNSQIVYLPKIDEPYVVQTKPGWGTVTGSVKLQDGWMLVEQGTTLDSKGPETITAASGLITALAGLKAMPTTKVAQEPGLYRILFTDGYVSGLKRVGP